MIEEQHERFYDLIAEVIEDVGMARAIREGEATETVSHAEVVAALEAAA